MALIECPECGREVSASAAACPECAYPIAAGTPRAPGQRDGGTPKRPWWKTAIPLFVRVVAGAILIGVGADEESVAAIIGGLLVGGSAIPAWYRDKIERMKVASGVARGGDRLEERITEMEQRHREQLAQLGQMHAGQIAELEERIDFAERLLTEKRGIGPG
jgi:hypothetical protein